MFPRCVIECSGKARIGSTIELTQESVASTAAAKSDAKLVSIALFPSMLVATQTSFLSVSCHYSYLPFRGLYCCNSIVSSAQSRFDVLLVVMKRPSDTRRKLEILGHVARQASRRVLEMFHQVQSSLQLPCVDTRPHEVPEDSPPWSPVPEAMGAIVGGRHASAGDEERLAGRI